MSILGRRPREEDAPRVVVRNRDHFRELIVKWWHAHPRNGLRRTEAVPLPPVGSWDVTQVENGNFSEFFVSPPSNRSPHVFIFEGIIQNFDEDLSGWDMRNARTAHGMFKSMSKFTGKGLEHWRLDQLEHATGMFHNCPMFQANVSSWQLPNLVEMSFMFLRATQFTGPLFAQPPRITQSSQVHDMLLHSNAVRLVDLSSWNLVINRYNILYFFARDDMQLHRTDQRLTLEMVVSALKRHAMDDIGLSDMPADRQPTLLLSDSGGNETTAARHLYAELTGTIPPQPHTPASAPLHRRGVAMEIHAAASAQVAKWAALREQLERDRPAGGHWERLNEIVAVTPSTADMYSLISQLSHRPPPANDVPADEFQRRYDRVLRRLKEGRAIQMADGNEHYIAALLFMMAQPTEVQDVYMQSFVTDNNNAYGPNRDNQNDRNISCTKGMYERILSSLCSVAGAFPDIEVFQHIARGLCNTLSKAAVIGMVQNCMKPDNNPALAALPEDASMDAKTDVVRQCMREFLDSHHIEYAEHRATIDETLASTADLFLGGGRRRRRRRQPTRRARTRARRSHRRSATRWGGRRRRRSGRARSTHHRRRRYTARHPSARRPYCRK